MPAWVVRGVSKGEATEKKLDNSLVGTRRLQMMCCKLGANSTVPLMEFDLRGSSRRRAVCWMKW